MDLVIGLVCGSAAHAAAAFRHWGTSKEQGVSCVLYCRGISFIGTVTSPDDLAVRHEMGRLVLASADEDRVIPKS